MLDLFYIKCIMLLNETKDKMQKYLFTIVLIAVVTGTV